jgi:tetratricopeptide (TPR) repeat protein
MKANKPREALAKVNEADSVSNKTSYENFIIERMRGPAAAGAGDSQTAAKAFEAVINFGRLSAAEQLKLIEAMTGTYYRSKEYAKAISWAQRYFKDGGTNGQVRTLLVQSQYLSGDFSGAAKALNTEIGADEKAGRAPTKEKLLLLANCYLKLEDFGGYANTLEGLVTYYPKTAYWADLITRIIKKPGFSDRMLLDVYRLQYATGNVREVNDYMEMTQLALQAGLPAEAGKIVSEGFSKNILGTGADADRQKRLRDLANKQAGDDQKALPQNEAQANAAKEGNALTNVGYAYVTIGEFDKGIALIEKGIEKGGLKHPEDAKLHLGLVYLQAGNKAEAVPILKSVRGTDGAADLARLWILQAK